MKVQAIIPTAGTGTRLNAEVPKPLITLNEKPIFIRTLESFEKSELIDSCILVVHADYINEYEKLIKKGRLHKISKIIAGGATRYDSVNNGIKIIDQDTDFIVVHDGARPLVTTGIINEAIQMCQSDEAVVVAVPVKPTIKKVEPDSLVVKETLQRDQLWEIQTPQVFKKDILIKAYQQKANGVPTDDATLVERLGIKVKVLKGDYRNVKITTQDDLTFAKALVESAEAVTEKA